MLTDRDVLWCSKSRTYEARLEVLLYLETRGCLESLATQKCVLALLENKVFLTRKNKISIKDSSREVLNLVSTNLTNSMRVVDPILSGSINNSECSIFRWSPGVNLETFQV